MGDGDAATEDTDDRGEEGDGSGELDGVWMFAGEEDRHSDVDESALSDLVVVISVSSSGLAVVVVDVVVVVVVDCPFL